MAAHSKKVLCRPHRWHVQETGEGPTLVLVHGAGGATQSWRHLYPLLTQQYRVVAFDLPGQGFSECGAKARLGLHHMAEDVSALLDDLALEPRAIIGHSAGAAIALRMALEKPTHVIGINAALSNFDGLAGWLFPMMAKALSLNPISARIFSKTASRSSIEGLVKGTGSKLGPDGIDLYYRLARDAGHVDATLGMMAQWSLDGLIAQLHRINSPVDLIVGTGDLAVPPRSSADAAKSLPNAKVHQIAGYGHLVHEEAPDETLSVIAGCLQAAAR